ncbi:MAG: adenylosuccinate lyase, partial [Nitrospira sp.]|nr:adenylosuccinate lyase [Nitrospira sp.]
SWKTGAQFRTLLLKDKEIRKYLDKKEIENIFDLKYYLKNVNYIFKRVFA